MDAELYLIGRMSALRVVYHKVRLSLIEIKETHPERTDLIDSMNDSENQLLQTIEFLEWMSNQWRVSEKLATRFQRENTDLKYELNELKKLNEKLTKNLTI